MISTIAAKEFREMIRDGRFRYAGGAVVLLLLGALVVGWRSARDMRSQHDDAARFSPSCL